MKLGRLWKNYNEYTANLSKTFRTLAISGAAICWVLKGEDYTFTSLLLYSLSFIAVYFIADIIHYFSAAMIYKRFARNKEVEMFNDGKSYTSETEVKVPTWLDKWPFAFFIIKSLLIIIAYFFIILELVTRINVS